MAARAGAYEDFFTAVKLDDVNQVRALLQRGLDPNIIEPERGDTGLILSLREGAMKVFDLLLQTRGIELEARARNGDNALMVASYKGNKAAVAALLARKVEVNRPGWTALHYAAVSGSNDILRMLLEKNAALDARSPNDTTPIMMAVYVGHIHTVKLLLDAGADATLKNDQGLTAIDFAKNAGRADIVEGLTYRLKKAGKLQ
jgi:ankyrin repeat protein